MGLDVKSTAKPIKFSPGPSDYTIIEPGRSVTKNYGHKVGWSSVVTKKDEHITNDNTQVMLNGA